MKTKNAPRKMKAWAMAGLLGCCALGGLAWATTASATAVHTNDEVCAGVKHCTISIFGYQWCWIVEVCHTVTPPKVE